MGDYMSNFGVPSWLAPSPANTSVSVLGSAGVFGGGSEENRYPSVLVNVETDVSGTLYIGFSVDGVNWKEELILINHGVFSYNFRREKSGSYTRIRYVNGSSAQSFFRLYTYYGDFDRSVPIERSNRGAEGVAVYVQDQTTGILDLPFSRGIAEQTLSLDTAVGAYSVTLTSAASVSVGDILEISDDANGSYFMQAQVLSKASNTVTIDTPVNRVYETASTTVLISSREMNVDGSSTPVVFSISPLAVQSGDIVRAICSITDNSDMDFETFGGISALTKGLVLRINNGDGTFRNISNFKTNGDIENYAFDSRFEENNGGGVRSFSARLTWAGPSKHGVAIRLDGSLSESLELLVQDDLTALSSMRWIAQGSELQN